MSNDNYKYLALKDVNGVLEADENQYFDYPWSDDYFVTEFEKQIKANFNKIKGSVVIDGAQFNNCTIYKPKSDKDNSYFIKTDINNLPIETGYYREIQKKELSINKALISNYKLEVGKSELFYKNEYVDLSNNFLFPSLKVNKNALIKFLDERVLLKYPSIIIEGAAGSGKTTLVRKLTYDLVDSFENDFYKDTIFPIYFKLREFKDISTELDNALDNYKWNLNPELIQDKLNKGKLLVILDGADELSVENRKRLKNWLTKYINNKNSLRLILTTRSAKEFEDITNNKFTLLSINPLENSQIKELAHRLLSSKTEATIFTDSFINNNEIKKILSNPLSLSFSLALYKTNRIIPTNTSSFFNSISDLLTNSWDESRSITRYHLLNGQSIKVLYGRLAYYLTKNKAVEFDTELFKTFIFQNYSYDTDPNEILKELNDYSGILQLLENNCWAFTHKYFQEFFCAHYLINRSQGVYYDFRKYKNDNLWFNIWKYATELSNDPEYFIKLDKRISYSPFHSFSRIVASFISSNFISDYKNISFSNDIIKNLNDIDKYVKKIVNGKEVKIEFKDSLNFDLEIFVSLIIQIYNHQQLFKHLFDKNKFSEKPSKTLKLISRITEFKKMPKHKVKGRKITFLDE